MIYGSPISYTKPTRHRPKASPTRRSVPGLVWPLGVVDPGRAQRVYRVNPFVPWAAHSRSLPLCCVLGRFTTSVAVRISAPDSCEAIRKRPPPSMLQLLLHFPHIPNASARNGLEYRQGLQLLGAVYQCHRGNHDGLHDHGNHLALPVASNNSKNLARVVMLESHHLPGQGRRLQGLHLCQDTLGCVVE